MEDMSAGIAKILEDPNSMDKIREMANSLFGENKSEKEKPKTNIPDLNFEGLDVGSLMKIGNALKNGGNDNRSQLLLALKPHLSEQRQDRVDKAVKILRLVSLFPLIKESGIF